jgi:hypothetical protein
MKFLLNISILSLVSYHIIKSYIDLNTYEKNQKYWVDIAFELSFDWNTSHFQIKSWIRIYESWETSFQNLKQLWYLWIARDDMKHEWVVEWSNWFSIWSDGFDLNTTPGCCVCSRFTKHIWNSSLELLCGQFGSLETTTPSTTILFPHPRFPKSLSVKLSGLFLPNGVSLCWIRVKSATWKPTHNFPLFPKEFHFSISTILSHPLSFCPSQQCCNSQFNAIKSLVWNKSSSKWFWNRLTLSCTTRDPFFSIAVICIYSTILPHVRRVSTRATNLSWHLHHRFSPKTKIQAKTHTSWRNFNVFWTRIHISICSKFDLFFIVLCYSFSSALQNPKNQLDIIESDIKEIENAIFHLERSNIELIEAYNEDCDPLYKVQRSYLATLVRFCSFFEK